MKGNTGHFPEYGYSLRIKTKSNVIDSIKSFNLQPPKVKNYEDEWFFHAIGKKLGLTVLDCYFIKLVEENTTKLYNVEEHFHENFLTRRKK